MIKAVFLEATPWDPGGEAFEGILHDRFTVGGFHKLMSWITGKQVVSNFFVGGGFSNNFWNGMFHPKNPGGKNDSQFDGLHIFSQISVGEKPPTRCSLMYHKTLGNDFFGPAKSFQVLTPTFKLQRNKAKDKYQATWKKHFIFTKSSGGFR